MENMFYLLNVSIAGIKCIKEKIRLDFYKKTVDKKFNPDRYRVKAIYGENGSGKSAIITAIKIFQDLMLQDNYLNESKTQVFLNEIINKSTQKFHFDCEFLVDAGKDNARVVYEYSIHIAKNENGLYEIQSETLRWKNGGYANHNYKRIFESKNGELLYVSCSDDRGEALGKKLMNLLSSRPFINLYIMNCLNWFNDAGREAPDKQFSLHVIMCSMLTFTMKVYLGEEDQHELYLLQKKLAETRLDNPALQEGLLEYTKLASAFSGVSSRLIDKKDFERYQNKIARLGKFIKLFKPDLVSIDIDAKENGEQYECDLNLNYGSYRINREFESTGIKKLIRLFDCFSAASKTGIVFVDEMDSNLNDVYLCRLIEYFMYYGKGQLCFTTHNLDPMTVLKENKNSIDFLSSDNHLVPWTSRGNASPENCYKNGMIEDSPFNIDATDFVGIFGE